MEALATAHPARFSAECHSLARPVASCVLAMMENGAAAAAEIPFPDANNGDETPQTEPFAATKEGENDENSGNSCASKGHVAAAQQTLSGNGNAAAIENRKALDLWVDMLGICLLSFCKISGGGGCRGGGAVSGNQRNGASNGSDSNNEPAAAVAASATAASADTVQGNDPFDSDSDSEEEEEEKEDADSGDGGRNVEDGFSDGGKGWVAGWWMRRAGSALAVPLECPFDVQPGREDEELPRRLAAFIAVNAKVRSCVFLVAYE